MAAKRRAAAHESLRRLEQTWRLITPPIFLAGLVLVIVCGVGLAGALALRAFRENVMFYFDPSKVAAGQVKVGQRFRLGGMVVKGSVQRQAGTLNVRFVVTDFAHTVPVSYSNVLPDLFKEGKGVVAQGTLGSDGVFRATDVLAKHDENYMPPEAKAAIDAAHKGTTMKSLHEPTPGAR